MKQLLLGVSLNHQPTLENFVIGQNTEAVQALYQCSSGQLGERFIYLWGNKGSGKTHLLQAIVRAAQQLEFSAAYLNQYSAISQHVLGHIVAVDDANRLPPQAQIDLFNLYNEIQGSSGYLIVAGDAPPAQLILRSDLTTRLGSGLVYQLHNLSDSEKPNALEQHAEARGFKLPQDVIDYLLRHWRRDITSLVAMLEALDHYSLEHKRSVTLPLLLELLKAEEIN